MLTWLLREHPDEIESDFWRLYGRGVFDFAPSKAAQLVAGVLSDPGSATYRAVYPDWQWHLIGNQLAAAQTDLLALLWWAKTRDGQKNRNRPKPVPRPGVNDPEAAGNRIRAEEVQLMTPEELDAYWALPSVPI